MPFAGEGPPAEGLPVEGLPSGEMFDKYSIFFSKENLCHLLAKGLLLKGLLLKGLLLKKCLKVIQTFFKRKPVPFAAEGPPGEGPPVEGPPVEGPPSGEMFERYSNLLQKKTCAICCRRASC